MVNKYQNLKSSRFLNYTFCQHGTLDLRLINNLLYPFRFETINSL